MGIKEKIERHAYSISTVLLIVLFVIIIVDGIYQKQQEGTPKIVGSDFNRLFSGKQVYYVENDPLPFSDESIGLLLSKTDNDFGQGNGDYYAIGYNHYCPLNNPINYAVLGVVH